MAEHKCSECGYLALRNRRDYGLNEADSDFRDKGIVPTVYDEIGRNPHKLHREIPLCFAVCQYLPDALKSINESSNLPEQIRPIIQTAHECKEFTEWKQGFTPKEHQEMLDRQWRLEYEARRDAEDKAWRESQEKWRSKEEWKRYWFLAAITIVAVILAFLLGYFIK